MKQSIIFLLILVIILITVPAYGARCYKLTYSNGDTEIIHKVVKVDFLGKDNEYVRFTKADGTEIMVLRAHLRKYEPIKCNC